MEGSRARGGIWTAAAYTAAIVEVAGSIPGLAQLGKNLALAWAVV